ncbi:MAG: fatty-acid--CoA ligase [Acidimicrobiia bacterium]
MDGTLEVTWADYARRVRAIAAGLNAVGMRRGDTLATMLVNRPEFNLVDTATMHLGVASFSLYNTLPHEQIAYQLGNSRASVVVTEPQFLEQVLAARTPAIHTVVLVEGTHTDAMTLADLEGLEPGAFDFDAAWRAVEPSDVLTLVYTSGTTGNPKGVELMHSNVLAACRGFATLVPPRPEPRVLSFLPAAHMGERWTAHYYPSICLGGAVTTVPSIADVPVGLRQVRPTMMITVARILEKLQAALQAAGVTDPGALDDEAKRAALASVGLDQADWVATGGGPVNPEMVRYFLGLGLVLIEVWGMTETGGLASANPPEAIRVGTAGKAFPGMELRLLDDGELLVRGPMVMRGYRDDPERTAEVLDADGWFCTGDIATVDDDGYVRIIDRKKEIIINAAGKNMSPANIEFQIKAATPLVGQAVCIGEGRSYNVALLVLDSDTASRWAAERGLDTSVASLAENEELHATIDAAVGDANSHLARVEQIKKFAVLPNEWIPAGDELTPTGKLKRRHIHEKYADVIEQMYAD